jgi:hypothetical protein
MMMNKLSLDLAECVIETVFLKWNTILVQLKVVLVLNNI